MRHAFSLLIVSAVLAFPPPADGQSPVASHQVSATSRSVAVVNGVPVTADRLATAIDGLLPATSFHRNVDDAKQTEVRLKAMRAVLNEELVYQEGRRLGIRVTGAELDMAVAVAKKKYPTAKAFDDALRVSGATMADLRREMTRALTVQKAWKQVVADGCRVPDADVAAFYRENPQRFVVPEQVHLFTITIGVPPSGTRKDWQDARKRTEDLLAQIKAGASFEEMARTHSSDPSKDKGGDMGWIHRGRMTDEFEAVTKSMKPGQVSEPVESLFGYHLVRLAEIKPAEQRTLDQVRPQLAKDLTAKRCEAAGETWLSGLRRKARITVHDPALAAAAQDPPPVEK